MTSGGRMSVRRIGTMTVGVSAALLAAVLALWLRSYWIYDQVSWGTNGWTWIPYPKAYQFSRWPPAAPDGTVWKVLTVDGKLYFNSDSYREAPFRSARGSGWQSDNNIIPSFSYLYATTGDMTREGTWTVIQASVRLWAIATILGVLPVAWGVRRRRLSEPKVGFH